MIRFSLDKKLRTYLGRHGINNPLLSANHPALI